ncbi:Rbs1p LALA0_S05e07844g [Lachancea lanzarotensis]|uniref:LALA0S05e07844g1_1 n=1 Tax=Lachancea lanzarotensis TaxID=1245769 RepID=A0A0C7N7R5_9SACH|nr:uncharacterized protein LALA0_S05e07844g [Lachancea lanzarotensis]CEP62537.1 LALA0S05e07844g1_1 [Lachancea lanzarotensis]
MGGVHLTKAMSVALFERSHDRQFVVDLENTLVTFMSDPGHSSYQLGPMNSYYRLLAHQLADYHGLKHALAKNNDTCVVFSKGEESFARDLDRILLQNVDPKDVTCLDPVREPNGSRNSRSGWIQGSGTHNTGNVVRVVPGHVPPSDSGPATPQKSRFPAIDDDDDSPQPHRFETSRYSFEQQAEKPRQKQRRFHKRSHSLATPLPPPPPAPVYYQPPFTLPVPYMMYNPYPMMYIPPEQQFPPYYQNPNAFHMNHYATFGPGIEPPQTLESSRSDSSVFSGRKSESTTDNGGQVEKTR